ncbi:MAG: LON peptidase substrate-binding domain-containing protein [Caldimonas sp.]
MAAPVLPDPELPLFPLHTVLFPDGLLELKIFEARYLDLISRCMRESRPFGVVCLKSGREAGGSAETVSLHGVGTLAELIGVDAAQAGILIVRCRGTQRFALGATRRQVDGLWLGDASALGDDPAIEPAAAHVRIVKSLADAIVTLGAQGAAPFLQPNRFDSAGWVANRWCEILPLDVEARQQLMALADPLERLEIVDSMMRAGHDMH